jgi:hypothetical protein
MTKIKLAMRNLFTRYLPEAVARREEAAAKVYIADRDERTVVWRRVPARPPSCGYPPTEHFF